MRDPDLDEAVDGLLEDIFARLRSIALPVLSPVELSSTDLSEGDNGDWADDRPTPLLPYTPPPTPPGFVWVPGAHRVRV
jgi:hypothetical protein